MCRIAGIIDRHASNESLNDNVQKMCNAMAHGGPDDAGFHLPTANTVFGHRRLALIDLSVAGHQPMLRKKLTISFNGEIYNYLELKATLTNFGATFNTHTDTEVILAGFEMWGVEIFNKLEGMFAFALYDGEINATYLVRDQSGIKPLYYNTTNDKLIFASEVKAFSQTNYTFEEDKDWKVYFLAFGHLPHPFTTLKNVFSLPAGSFLSWSHSDQTSNIQTYRRSKTAQTITKPTEIIAKQLRKAVQSHLIADAPIGVFLSGGIDSSILTLLANEVTGKNLNTLSINFVEEEFSEAKYQKVIADKIKGKHSSYQVTQADFEANFEEIVQSMDQPTNDGINSWFVNKCAKENGLKAVLSGIGADELYGGYPSFKRMDLIKKLKRLPKSILKLCKAIPSDKLKRIYYLSYQNAIGDYLFLRGFFVPAAIAKILDRPQSEVDNLLKNIPYEPLVDELKGEERAAWLETNLFMKNQLLKDTDFMSMAHGIEVRLPFLDHDFLALTESIANEKRFTAQPKGALINAFKNILPEAIWNRPKMGFTFPLQQWFIKHGKITDETLYKNQPETLRLIRLFKAGKLHWSKAYALYQVRG
ncbi:MAG: asparagine synthase (glutamine-hydrolyzing) [Flavobacterium sp.]|nr:MAG: asparagine synthase (glutamine-hydrolyzing) [Flavobacterium sp.]